MKEQAEIVTRELHFSVEGEFITKIAREWYWVEHKPWHDVQNFLLDCMCGTDQSKEELIDLARKVIYGQAKFIGNTADGSYALVDDSKDLVFEYRDNSARRIQELKSRAEEAEGKYYNLRDYLIDSGYDYILRDAGHLDEPMEEIPPILESYLTEKKIEREHCDNYGWLAPDGTFTPVEWGDHQKWANEKLKNDGVMKKEEYLKNWDRGGDYLVSRGWILLHNPSHGIAQVTADPIRRITKAQKEFLFDYYTKRGLHSEAKMYLED